MRTLYSRHILPHKELYDLHARLPCFCLPETLKAYSVLCAIYVRSNMISMYEGRLSV